MVSLEEQEVVLMQRRTRRRSSNEDGECGGEDDETWSWSHPSLGLGLHEQKDPSLNNILKHHPDLESTTTTTTTTTTTMVEEAGDKLDKVMTDINDICGMPDCRAPLLKKECGNLVRRLKLLVPMFEEIKESFIIDEHHDSNDDSIDKEKRKGVLVSLDQSLKSMHSALISAKELLKYANEGSKLFMVLEREHVTSKMHDTTSQLEQALSDLPYLELGLSDEVCEQVELVHAQFRRAKGRVDMVDTELENDLNILLSQKSDKDDNDILRRMCEKLHLKTIPDLKQESLELHDLVIKSGDATESLEQMSHVLRRLKDFVLTENPDADTETKKSSSTCGSLVEKSGSPVIPDDFRCPISLELMKDPVIVATGQTYERSCIQKWLNSGHKTCPKTQQTLVHTVLTPNYVLRSLIFQWCEANGIEPPKKPGSSKSGKAGGSALDSSGDRETVKLLLQKLTGGGLEEQREAACELRLLAKRNVDNRICIAEAGAIPILVNLLSTTDGRTQEHAVTALLNLSIYESNKSAIVRAGAIDPIVEVLKNGSMEARENAAATLFSLSVVDENKVTIGESDAIPALVGLLCEGSQRGKKDAATALFNLSIYQGNKAKAVRAGVVGPLMQLLDDPSAGMVDESLAILAILACHQEGKVAIGNADAIPMLVEIIKTGSPRNRENASAVLLALCSNDAQHVITARKLGAYEPLIDLSQNGTTRAKRKSAFLLELFHKSDQPPAS